MMTLTTDATRLRYTGCILCTLLFGLAVGRHEAHARRLAGGNNGTVSPTSSHAQAVNAMRAKALENLKAIQIIQSNEHTVKVKNTMIGKLKLQNKYNSWIVARCAR